MSLQLAEGNICTNICALLLLALLAALRAWERANGSDQQLPVAALGSGYGNKGKTLRIAQVLSPSTQHQVTLGSCRRQRQVLEIYRVKKQSKLA